MKTPMVYEEAAERRTVEGWFCKKCGRFFGEDEHLARWCCATDIPCECGRRNTCKTYIKCQSCRDELHEKKWQAALAKAISWDGEWPLAIWDDDRYFFNDWDLESYLEDHNLADCRFVICEAHKMRRFEMGDYLCDDLPEDDNTNFNEIDIMVNKWIADNAPKLYFSTGQVVTTKSVVEQLNF